MISINIATQEKRLPFLIHAIESLKNQTVQADVIRVYANGFSPILPGVEVKTGRNRADNGKFYWKPKRGEIYFTCDDDLFYPPDYVENTLQRLKVYPECIVSYHGRKLLGRQRGYYNGHETYHCLGKVRYDAIIDVPGTGVMAFNSKYFKHYGIANEPDLKMADVVAGLYASRQNVEVVCLAHDGFWIKDINTNDGGIYVEARNNDSRQTELCDQILDNKYPISF